MTRGFVPDWQRALIALSATVLLAVVVLALYWGRSLFIPIALAVLITFVLSPVVSRLQKRGLGRTAAVATTITIALIVSAAVGAVIAQQIVQLSEVLTEPDRSEAFKQKIAEAKRLVNGDEGSPLGRLVDDVSGIIFAKPAGGPPATPVVIQSESPQWVAHLESYVSPIAEFLAQAAFTFVLTIFMLLNREDLRNRMIRLTGHGKVTTTTKAVDDGSRRVSKYLLMQLLVNSTFGLLIAIGLLIIGVKLALLWGAIAALMRYIPYLGTWIGLGLATLFTFALSEGWAQPLAVLALFFTLEMICNNYVEPKVYGASMGLSEVAQLVAAGFWALMWGPVGLILSGPLTVCLLVLGKYVSRFEYLDILLSDEPVLAPRIAFYQRLTARDQDEAAGIALKAAGAGDAVVVFDDVIVPALCLAKRDHVDGNLSLEDLTFAVRAAREVADIVTAAHPIAEATGAGSKVRLLLCPARDEVDHAGIELLADLLDPTRWELDVVTAEMLASELLARVEEFQPAAVLIGSLPPSGLAHTRYLVTRVRSKFPDLKIIIGRWGKGDEFPDDPAQASGGGADWVNSTLAETRKLLTEWYEVFSADVAPVAQPKDWENAPLLVNS